MIKNWYFITDTGKLPLCARALSRCIFGTRYLETCERIIFGSESSVTQPEDAKKRYLFQREKVLFGLPMKFKIEGYDDVKN